MLHTRTHTHTPSLTLLNGGGWGLWLGTEVVGKQPRQCVLPRAKGTQTIWGLQLRVHLLKVGAEAKGDTSFL